ncbi:MAG: nucleoside hydrolase [Ruminococcus sp.]|nr:nucleoside hydrolase [Ruminococcus sp.]
MNFVYDIPDMRKIRVIIDTDAKAEADDQFAIVHALLTPKFLVKGIVTAHFYNAFTGENPFNDTMERSDKEAKYLVELLNLENDIPVFRGAKSALLNKETPQTGEGIHFIIEEALRDDIHPLFIVVQGTLTNVASALLQNPAIAQKMTVVWIGGAPYSAGGGYEFNLTVDLLAANIVFSSKVPMWQIPLNAYTSIKIGFAELYLKVRPWGEIGQYLYQQMIDYNNQRTDLPDWPAGESWSLGDSPVIAVLLDEHKCCYEEREAPQVDLYTANYIFYTGNRKIRVYHTIDSRFLLEDLFAKLQLYSCIKTPLIT